MRGRRWGTILAALIVAQGGVAAAQRPQVRDGFWVSFGFGGGSAATSCDGCGATTRETGTTAYVRLGGTVSPRVLLGGEVNVWTKERSGNEIALGTVSFVAMFYPRATGGLFLKGGVGYADYDADGTGQGSGFGVSVGAGYDVRVARNFSISPFGNFSYGAVGDITRGGSLVSTGWTQNVVELGLGFTFH